VSVKGAPKELRPLLRDVVRQRGDVRHGSHGFKLYDPAGRFIGNIPGSKSADRRLKAKAETLLRRAGFPWGNGK
jgi:hypothetical protein